MITPSPQKYYAGDTTLTSGSDEVSCDLRFIADLGRSLLTTIHPKKVAAKIAAATQQRLGATACVFVAEVNRIGLVSHACGPNGDIEESIIQRPKLERWLAFLPPQIGYLQDEDSEFLLKDIGQNAEYISPVHIDGHIKGALVIGCSDASKLGDRETRLIEAVTQLATMSVNLSAHYELALDETVNQTREEDRRFTESILDALPVSLYVVDRDYRIVTWNRHREVGVQGIPRDIALGRDVFDVLEKYPQGRLKEEFERAFRTGRIERIEQQTTADDGSTRHWLVSKVPMRGGAEGDVTHVITVGEDVTVRVEAIQAINRAEKLAAVGRLAAGVVHEINNPLATIAACAEALENRVDDGDFEMSDSSEDLREYLGLIKSEAFRCKTITTDLLDFSRIRAGERSPVDVGEIVRSTANLISHQKRGSGIEQALEVEPGVSPVSADGGQLQQAIITLATNAIDAMPIGGKVTFRVYQNGNRVVIEVQDTGHGIPPEHVSKIFEPFFTTKEVGKGTGLGLSVCYGIVSEHGGRISVKSNLGLGSTFSIFLPASQAQTQ